MVISFPGSYGMGPTVYYSQGGMKWGQQCTTVEERWNGANSVLQSRRDGMGPTAYYSQGDQHCV